MEIFIIVWAVCAAIGYAVANPKGKGSTGIVLGLFLGIIGIIIAACLSDSPEVAMRKRQQMGSYTHTPMQSRPQGLAGWHPDPYQRWQSRYFDGFVWTNHVASNGIQSLEPAGLQPQQG